MASLLAFAYGVSSFGLPMIGFAVLLASKVAPHGKRAAESFFVALLTLLILVTIRTVMTNDPAWLTHTLTLALMILGAVCLPAMNQEDRSDSLADRSEP